MKCEVVWFVTCEVPVLSVQEVPATRRSMYFPMAEASCPTATGPYLLDYDNNSTGSVKIVIKVTDVLTTVILSKRSTSTGIVVLTSRAFASST